jgi:hypothetical protein
MTAASTIEEYGALRDMMIEVKTRLDFLIAQTSTNHVDHESRLRALEQRVDPSTGDHESRIRKLERMVWLAAGASSAVGGALGAWMSAVAGA